MTAPTRTAAVHRARVALEERHSPLRGRLLRWPYRALIVAPAAMAQRSAREGRRATTS